MSSPEELARLIEQTVRAVLAGIQGTSAATANGQPNVTGRRTLDPKGVSRVETFAGKEKGWKEWSFQFKVAIKAMDGRASEIMGKCESDEQGHDISSLELEYATLDVGKVAGELYDLLCLCLRGDPLILVQGVTTMNGFEAWGKLYRRFKPVTPARALQAMIAVMVPQKVK